MDNTWKHKRREPEHPENALVFPLSYGLYSVARQFISIPAYPGSPVRHPWSKSLFSAFGLRARKPS